MPRSTAERSESTSLAAGPKEHRLFHIPEILEAILYELPTKDLLFGKAVCKNWRDAIDGSVKLQKALFLIVDGHERTVLWDDNTLCVDDVDSNYPLAKTPRPNPLLKRFLRALDCGQFSFDSNGELVLPREGSGTWKHMLLSQPPMPHIGVFAWSPVKENLEHDTLENEVIKDEGQGVRMSDVLKAAEVLNEDGCIARGEMELLDCLSELWTLWDDWDWQKGKKELQDDRIEEALTKWPQTRERLERGHF